MSDQRAESNAESLFLRALDQRVLVFDGAMGTNIQASELPLSDYRGLENCNEILSETRPDILREIHTRFLQVGCDAVETNTFGANKIVLAEFGLAGKTRELNRLAARVAREACDAISTPEHPRFVAGSMGPGTKLVSLRQTTFDILADSYAEQVRGLLDGGVDLLVIETCQDILQCKAAIAAAGLASAEAGRRLPIVVQVTMTRKGVMLVGTDIAAVVTALDPYPQIAAIGLNCATGPREMGEYVRYLSEHCTKRISVMPNAGLPQVVDGRPYYSLTPEDFAQQMTEFVERDGVNIVGGCCGTTPDHLARVVEAVGGRKPRPRQARLEPGVSSIYYATPLKQDKSFLIVGERTNANGSKQFRELLAAEDIEGMVQVGKQQVKAGSHMIDVCVAYVGRDELADMNRLISRLATEVQVPLMIDSTEVAVIEAALKLAGGRCIINSINLEDGEQHCGQILDLCRKYGSAVVALTIDEEGMAKTAERKLAIAHRIHQLATAQYGLRSGDLLFDPLTFTICTGNEEDRRLGLETLEALRRIKRELPECHTLLGVSNISFGLKPFARHLLNSVFLHHAREAGLDGAIINPATIKPLHGMDEDLREVARKLIFDERTGDYDPLADLLTKFTDDSQPESEETQTGAPVEERLRQRVIDGNRSGLTRDLDEALARHKPLEIISDILLAGMKVVGELFGSGQTQLPFVLQSAETVKAAVAYLEPRIDRTQEAVKGSIVLATVKGDVHDIGKNLVDILLTNNGYTVHNLGIKQPIEAIIDAWQDKKADAIGLSGLLVKSTIVMRDSLAVLNERGLAPMVILGGAALTRRYVEQELAPLYKGRLAYAKDAFEGLALMGEICVSGSGGAVSAPNPAARTVEPASAGHTAENKKSSVATDVPIPSPPFWGSRVIEQIPLADVLAFINEMALFQLRWQFKRKGQPAGEFGQYIDNEVRPIYRNLVERCERENVLQPQAVYGYWPCQSELNELIVYDPDDRGRELVRFDFPRQKKEPYWCLSDFWRPRASGEFDVVAMSVVTVGRRVGETARELFEADKYQDYLYLHGLGVESAEALAELVHKQVRTELDIADRDARELRQLLNRGYQGCRYSFGYPACPNLEDQAKIWTLLGPERIGLQLTEAFQIDPEQSTSAVIAHHPEARYFGV